MDIEKALFRIWKEGFDAEEISQYDYSDNVILLEQEVQELESLVLELKKAVKHVIEINILRINNGKSAILGSVAINRMAHLIDHKKPHEIKVKSWGNAELRYLQNVCTCGWGGRKFYGYEDLQTTLCREERESHLRIVK